MFDLLKVSSREEGPGFETLLILVDRVLRLFMDFGELNTTISDLISFSWRKFWDIEHLISLDVKWMFIHVKLHRVLILIGEHIEN